MEVAPGEVSLEYTGELAVHVRNLSRDEVIIGRDEPMASLYDGSRARKVSDNVVSLR